MRGMRRGWYRPYRRPCLGPRPLVWHRSFYRQPSWGLALLLWLLAFPLLGAVAMFFLLLLRATVR